MIRRFLILSILILATACRERVPLPELYPVPAAVLTSDSGKPLPLSSLRGNVVIYDFIFTRCGATCPLMTAAMNRLARRIPDSRLRFVSLSVDPSFDTPAVLQAYAKKNRSDPRWIFVTGGAGEVVRASVAGFKLAAGDSAPGGEAILHTSRFVLADSSGTIRGYYDAMSEDELRRLDRDVRRLLREMN